VYKQNHARSNRHTKFTYVGSCCLDSSQIKKKYLYVILHITTGEIFISCYLPAIFITNDECVEEYEVLSTYGPYELYS
jgi:hypothetical protein